MKLTTLAILCLFAIGCTGPSQTRAAFESDHPYAKIEWEVPPNDLRPLAIVQYFDRVPTIGFDGGNYRLVPTQHTMIYYPDGRVHSRETIEVNR